MRVLLYGGSFDPPHLGHAALLKAALKAVKPDRAYAFPAGRAPGKHAALASGADRLAMAKLAFRGLPVRVDPFELGRGGPSYTYRTLRRLSARHPGAELWTLLGSDAFASLGSWRRPAELRKASKWVVGRRPGIPVSGADRVLPGVFPDLRSTGLRARLTAGEAVAADLAPAVMAFIRRRGLYGLAHHARLARELAPERRRHSLAVAAMARELAERHGLDAEKAALAGLLHDCGRALPLPEMIRRASSLGLPLAAETARRQPILLHAHYGELRARSVYGVRDPQVLSAVRKHTLGDARMAPLDRLVYVADACSRDRSFPEAAAIRRTAAADLDAALKEAVRVKLRYALQDGSWIHPSGVALWNALAGS